VGIIPETEQGLQSSEVAAEHSRVQRKDKHCCGTTLTLNRQLGLLEQQHYLFNKRWSQINQQGVKIEDLNSGAFFLEPANSLFYIYSAYELGHNLFLSLENVDGNVILIEQDSIFFTGAVSCYLDCDDNIG